MIQCPVCRKSICDPKSFEEEYDRQIAETQMPAEYKDKLMTVLCNDCLKKSNVAFHIVGAKCKSCNSYNTTRIVDEIIENENKDEEQEEQKDI